MPIDQAPHTGANTMRLFFSLAIMSLGVAATLATVLGFFGSAWWAFDLLAGYRLQFAILLILVASGFRIGFGIATGALFLAAGIANAVIVLPLFLGGSAAADGASERLTVASIPVEETGRQEAMDWVVEAGVDIAFLMDTDDTWSGVRPPSGSGYVTVDQLFIGRQTGMTIVARSEMEVTVTAISNTNSPAVRAVTTMNGEEVIVYALLLPSPGTNTEAEQRNDLLERIALGIAAESAPVAIIGDIGVSQWSHSFGILKSDGALNDSSPGNGFQAATPGSVWIGLRVPTHHLLHTDTLTVTERHLGPDLGHGRTILQGTVTLAAG